MQHIRHSLVLLLLMLGLLRSTSAYSKKPLIVLGSGSATRKLILKEAGYDFEVLKADIDEYAIGDRSSGDGARELVTLLGNAKADAILAKLRAANDGRGAIWPNPADSRVLLTADQVVVCNNQILEKPSSEGQARQYLSLYASHPCSTVGSIVLTSLATGKRVCGVDSCTIHFSPIPGDTVDKLIAEGTVYQCAGGLMIEHPLVQPCIQRVEGSMDSVMGLSGALLEKLMGELASR